MSKKTKVNLLTFFNTRFAYAPLRYAGRGLEVVMAFFFDVYIHA